ncbi:Mrr restriction system protein [Cellulophaga baltica 4]|nr:Mrr restriction system protein [Cellulophaga baltica 4]
MKKISKSKQIAIKTIYATLQILKDSDGELRGKEVVDKIRNSLEFNEYENHIYEKTGYVRWESMLHFYTIDAMKAGFMRKQKGTWLITQEGVEALDKYNPEELLDTITKKYKEWEAKNKKDIPSDEEDEILKMTSQNQKALLDQYEETASSGIRDFVIDKNPYEFQDIVAALLEVMGYHISTVAERGPDGGIDIIAYTDPLGTSQPRIIVQVKHRPNDSISSDEIQKLSGTLKRSSDVGIFVTSGKFSRPAIKEAVNSREHIELIDFERFKGLWQEYYNRLSDIQKNMLPLQPIYFLGSNE